MECVYMPSRQHWDPSTRRETPDKKHQTTEYWNAPVNTRTSVAIKDRQVPLLLASSSRSRITIHQLFPDTIIPDIQPKPDMNSPRPHKRPRMEEPTTFLSIPREIRQVILIQTFDDKQSVPQTIYTNFIRAIRRVYNEGTNENKACKENLIACQQEYLRCLNWVEKLSEVHEVVRKDMVYVEAEWRRAFDERLGGLYVQLAAMEG